MGGKIEPTGTSGKTSAPAREPVGRLRMSDEDEAFWEQEARYLYGTDGIAGGSDPFRERSRGSDRLRLYTATIASTRDNVMLQAFHASFARSVAEVRARLAGRYGPHLADVAEIRPGLHRGAPLVVALVPRVVVEMIVGTQKLYRRPEAREFGVDIQQVIHA